MKALVPLFAVVVSVTGSAAWIGLATFLPVLAGIVLVREKLVRRLLLFIAIAVTAGLAENWCLDTVQSSNEMAPVVGHFDWCRIVGHCGVLGVWLFAAWFCFGERVRMALEKLKRRSMKSAIAGLHGQP